ncbi:helix-turn-helix transcriptional regulator [Halosimplex pelagicum]|uniref:Helix-turn-helix domain-containing protein n=1 Tax=Halosimplex pelagicum TaxID=869886 RepID=A0A7D5T624_9EURY|nr:helix-turn-helix domain-containing protein [Halosimplex pelagicum]QLH83851.1 helix-turn-helix domain-containing protein [Halosimplex pelagicum]
MLQWLVGDAVGEALAVGAGTARATDARGWLSLSADAESQVGVLQSASAGDVGGMMVAAVVLVVLGLGGVAAWHSGLPSLGSTGSSSEGGSTTEPDGPATTETPSEPDPTAEPKGEPDEPAARTDRELIVDILESNEGRMKQARIVDETGWSKSKVSMLLSEMEEEEAISKLRVGRENIISLSGNEPEAAGSPFDDE